MSNENRDCLRRSGASSRLSFLVESSLGLSSSSHNSFCALRVKRPEPSLKPHGSTTGLERADQIYATKTPTQLIEPMSNQLNAPTWVTSRHYPTQRTANALACYLNNV
ncbi:hypothetical protein V6N13_070549 [Hibiscus sabdariffa]